MIATFLDTMQTLEEEEEAEAVMSATSMSCLPEEIQVDIFVKLPLKSILMSRCVCKLWRNLLYTSKFIKYHHNYNIIQNKNISYYKLISITRDSYSIYSTTYNSVSSSPLPSFDKAVHMVEILGSCDGLVCLGIHGCVIGTVSDRYYRICIWNPLTRKYKKVPVKSQFQGIKPNHGFGYDRNIDTYKLVRIGGQVKETDSFDIQVYTLGSDSWNITRSEVPYYIPLKGRYTYGLLFNGALHWLGYKTDRETKYGVIVSFDISTERFGDVPLPAAAEDSLAFSSNGRPCEKSVAVLGDYLCLLNVEYVAHDDSSLADIWVMQKYGVQGSWTKQFSIDYTHHEAIIPYFHKNLRLVCDLENGELLISSGFTYDPKMKIFRKLNVKTKEMLISTARSYVESLVSPNSGIYVGNASE